MDYINRARDDDSLRKSAFQQLKPHCVAISQLALSSTSNPSSANQPLAKELQALLTVLTAISQQSPALLTPQLGDYIFFPLTHVFRQHQKLADTVVELGLRILEILVRICWRVKIQKELVQQLVILITFIIGGPPGAKSQQQQQLPPDRAASEESKVAGCKCLAGLFRAITLSQPCKGMFYEDQNLPATGHLITTLLEILVESADSVELGTAAVQALKVLLEECIKEDVDVLASFLPGIVSQFSKVLAPQKRTTRRAAVVMEGTIGLLGCVLYRVLVDPEEEETTSNSSKTITKKDTATSNSKDALKITRTKAWFTATSTHIKTALEGILSRNRSHSHPTVRTATLNLATGLLTNCLPAMEASQTIPLLVDTLIILSGADDDGGDSSSISNLATTSLQTLAVTIPSLAGFLQQSVHGWVLSLPRVMSSTDEDLKTRLVRRISAGVRIMNEMRVESEVLQDVIARNVRDSLEATQAFSGKEQAISTPFQAGTELMALRPPQPTSTTQMARGKGTGIVTVTGLQEYPDLILPHRTQRETIASLKHLLHIIGSTSSDTVLNLADRYIRESRDAGGRGGSPVALWIAVNLMRSTVQKSSETAQWLDIIDDETSEAEDGILEELFSVSLDILTDKTAATAYLPSAGSGGSGEDEEEDSTLTTCLSMEAVSLFAERHGEGFRHELVDVIYPIIHLLGSASPTVQRHAMVTLNNISHSCKYPSPQDLILDNMDYLVNSVALKLNTFDISPQAPAVLGMMVKLTGKGILPFLGDVVESIFAALGNYHGYEDLCRSLFGVLREVVDVSVQSDGGETGKKAIEEGKEGRGERNEARVVYTVERALKRFDETLKREERARREREELKQMEKDFKKGEFPRAPWGKPKDEKKFDPEAYLNGELNDDDLPTDGDPDSALIPQGEKPAEPTQTYKLIQKITRLTQHYLTHPSAPLRLQLLQLVGTSSVLLKVNEREFLPLVNDVWPVLFVRLFDEEVHVAVGAAEAVGALARACGGFISSRVNEGWKRGGGFGTPEGELGGVGRLVEKVRGRVERDLRGGGGGGGGGLGRFSGEFKRWEALLGMLRDVVRWCELAEEVFDDVLDKIGAEWVVEREDLRAALEEVNADAVWVLVEGRRWARECGVGGAGGWEPPKPPVCGDWVGKEVDFGWGGGGGLVDLSAYSLDFRCGGKEDGEGEGEGGWIPPPFFGFC